MKMRIRYIIEWRKLKKLKIKVAKLIAKLAMLKVCSFLSIYHIDDE